MNLIRMPDVRRRMPAPVSAVTIYAYIKDRGFPKPIKVGGRSFWQADAVEAWLRAQGAA